MTRLMIVFVALALILAACAPSPEVVNDPANSDEAQSALLQTPELVPSYHINSADGELLYVVYEYVDRAGRNCDLVVNVQDWGASTTSDTPSIDCDNP